MRKRYLWIVAVATSVVVAVVLLRSYGPWAEASHAGGADAFIAGVRCFLVLSPSSLPDPVVGVPYGATLQASGGTAPYSFAVSAGSLTSLPRSGEWMVWVERLFGVVLFAVMLGAPLGAIEVGLGPEVEGAVGLPAGGDAGDLGAQRKDVLHGAVMEIEPEPAQQKRQHGAGERPPHHDADQGEGDGKRDERPVRAVEGDEGRPHGDPQETDRAEDRSEHQAGEHLPAHDHPPVAQRDLTERHRPDDQGRHRLRRCR